MHNLILSQCTLLLRVSGIISLNHTSTFLFLGEAEGDREVHIDVKKNAESEGRIHGSGCPFEQSAFRASKFNRRRATLLAVAYSSL
ncbi:hypothetical protein B0H11DRAFT_2107301 [Mycena galericulata]|nr:hypothetical protein B0H11DRAFT_2107301 [Mycena galericulata]